jgi:hypothetical protein
LRLRKAGAGVGIEALPSAARSTMEEARAPGQAHFAC